MASIKNLAKDTVFYGLSTVVPRFLNWSLSLLYANVLPTTGQFGEVTNLYAYIGIFLVILTYGMETGFFRFVNDTEHNDPKTVYGTALFSLATTSSLFVLLMAILLTPLSQWSGYASCYIGMLALIVAIDAFSALPFAYLRYQHRPVRFLFLKLFSVILNISLNLFFFIVCPYLQQHLPGSIDWFYNADFGVGYILVANLVSSAATLLMLLPELCFGRWVFDGKLLKRILNYSYPILLLGIAGNLNQNIDKILYPLLDKSPGAMDQLGIYSASYKIAVVMVMFTTAFRFAYEPFIFDRKKKDSDNKHNYAEAMRYFIIFSCIIFVGVMCFIDLVKVVLPSSYYAGLYVIPIVMVAEMFSGIFFNLSVWYKVTDRTQWGAWFSFGGFAITLVGNVLFVPRFGYMACAWTAFACFFFVMMASYLMGRHYYPIPYDLRSAGRYFCLLVLFLALYYGIDIDNLTLRLLFRTVLFVLFLVYVVKKDLPLRQIPFLNRWFK